MSCLLQVSIHIFYMYDMSDHIQSKLIHLRWQIETYQGHIKYIQGQIRPIHRLIHLVIVFKSVATRIPDSTRLADPSRSPVYSDIFNYLPKTCCLCYSILDFLITWKHFNLGKPINIYKIMPLYNVCVM